MNVLEFQNVQKSFKERTVLKQINFAIGERQIIGLVGANGAGKRR